MTRGIAFLVVPAADEEAFAAFSANSLALHRRSTVKIFTDAASSSFATDINESVSRRLIEDLSTYRADDDDTLFIHREAKCSGATLDQWWRSSGRRSGNVKTLARAAIQRSLVQRWEAFGDHWRTYAADQIENFDGRSTTLETWLQQFGRLGCTSIGRKLASQIRVIRPREMQAEPFSLRPADLIGQSQAHCYVRDEDTGGSWVEIQATLMHDFPAGSVFAVDWDTSAKTLTFPDVEVDQFVVYEDGLWSGSELVRRLNAVQATPAVAQIVMRFGIVSDFGLLVGRHAIRSLGLTGRVTIDPTASELMRFIKEELPPALRTGEGYSIADYFRALHEYTTPYAFQPSNEWSNQEIETCRDIGAQLVRHWLAREPGARQTDEVIQRFALGGGGFASTTVFTRSVPKVCLPVFWLDGPVSVGSGTVDWKPLFVDARRIADKSLLVATD